MDILGFLDWGIAGIFAVAIFFVYRKTTNQMFQQVREDRLLMEERLVQIISDYKDTCDTQISAVKEFTVVLTELKTWLQAKNGNR